MEPKALLHPLHPPLHPPPSSLPGMLQEAPALPTPAHPAAPQWPSQVSSLSSLVQQHCRAWQSPPRCFLKIGGSLQVASPCRDTQDAGLGLLTPARTQHTTLQGMLPPARELGWILCSRFTSLNTQIVLKRR